MKEKDYPISPLNRDELKRRLGNSFPSVYLTVMGIIQAVALGILIDNFHYQISNESKLIEQFLISGRSVISFMMITLVLFEYNYFVWVNKWMPDFWDTLIPLALGASEIAPMYFLDDLFWWWPLNSILAAVGGLAFLNTRRRCEQWMFEDEEGNEGSKAYDLVMVGNDKNIRTSIYTFMLCWSCPILISNNLLVYKWEFAFIIVYLIAILYTFFRENIFLKKLTETYFGK